MADMKPVAPGAGSRRRFVVRAAALAGAFATAGCGGTAVSRARSSSWLEPLYGFSGATLTDKVHPTGQPMPGGNEISLSFMFPVAVVVCLGAIFVADAGYGKLFRYDRGSGLMAAVAGVRITTGSKLHADPYGTIYILDHLGSEIQRHSMQGLPLQTMHSRVPTGRYLDFAVDGSTGRVFAVDAAHRVVDQIEPAGRVAIASLELDASGPIALDSGTLLVASAQCGCVTEWRNGNIARRMAVGKVRLPRGLVADRGELYLLDSFDRSISRVYEGGLETIVPADVNLVSPEQIFVSDGIMYVADGVSRSVAVFRIRRRQH